MKRADRHALLFGPYRPPPLRRGDRAFCLARDCQVVITSWTQARIPWPRCRALGNHGGGSGLLVDDELARAVRNESAAAVMHGWGASQRAVYHCRTALGVTRTSNAPVGRGCPGQARQARHPDRPPPPEEGQPLKAFVGTAPLTQQTESAPPHAQSVPERLW